MAGLLEIIMCINVLSEAVRPAGLGWAGLGGSRHTEQQSYQHQPSPAQPCAQPRQANLIVHTNIPAIVLISTALEGGQTFTTWRERCTLCLYLKALSQEELPSNQAVKVTVNNRNNILKPGLLKSAGSVCKLFVI